LKVAYKDFYDLEFNYTETATLGELYLWR